MASAGRHHSGSHIVKDVCIHKLENINIWEQLKYFIYLSEAMRKLSGNNITEEAQCCMLLLLQQYGLYWLTFVIWNCNILRLLMKGRLTGTGSMRWTGDPLFLVNLVKMASWC